MPVPGTFGSSLSFTRANWPMPTITNRLDDSGLRSLCRFVCARMPPAIRPWTCVFRYSNTKCSPRANPRAIGTRLRHPCRDANERRCCIEDGLVRSTLHDNHRQRRNHHDWPAVETYAGQPPETVAPLPPAASAAVWPPPAMTPGTKANVKAKSRIPAASPRGTAVRPSPYLGLLVHRNLRLELHLPQRRSKRLRFALGCR